MSVIVVCKCGRDIVLKDEFIGKKVRCSVCKNVVFVKPPEPDAVGPAFVDDPELPNMGVRPQSAKPVIRDMEEDEEEVSTPGRRQIVSEGGGGGMGILWVLLVGLVLIILLAGGGTAAYFIYQNWESETAEAPKNPGPKEPPKKDNNQGPDPNAKVTRIEALSKLPHPNLAITDISLAADGQWAELRSVARFEPVHQGVR